MDEKAAFKAGLANTLVMLSSGFLMLFIPPRSLEMGGSLVVRRDDGGGGLDDEGLSGSNPTVDGLQCKNRRDSFRSALFQKPLFF